MEKKEELKKKQVETAIIDNVPMKAVEWMRQPHNITMLKGDMTRSQVNMMIELVSQLQEKIKEKLASKENLIFSDEDFDEEGYTSVDIPLSSITKDACKYNEIEEIARRIYDFSIVEKRIENGQEYEILEHVFDRVWIPTEQVSISKVNKKGIKRKGIIRFQMSKSKATKVFNLERYTKYIKSVAKGSRSQFTSRLYMLASAYKDFGKWTIPYLELHRIFGFSTYDKATRQWVMVKYPEYRKFRQRVLTPACEELRRMAEEGQTNLYFTFSEIYPNQQTKGQPDKIVFDINVTGYGRSQEEITLYEQRKMDIERLTRELFGFKTTDCKNILRLVTPDNAEYTLYKISELDTYIQAHSAEINDKTTYALVTLRNALTDLIPVAEEEKKETSTPTVLGGSHSTVLGDSVADPSPSSTASTPTAADLKGQWLRIVGQKNYQTYLSQVKLRHQGNKLLAIVPHTEVKEWMQQFGLPKLGVNEVTVER